MQASPKKVKLVLFSAILLAVILFVCSIALVVSIIKKQDQINKQEAQIEKLNNQLNYYTNNPPTPDSSVEIEEE